MPSSLPPPSVEAVVVYAPRLARLAGEAAFDALHLPGEVLRLNPRLDEALKTVPGVLQVDARAAWRFAPDADAYLAVENLADASIAVGQTADGTTSYAAPRMLRVGVAYRR